MKTQVWLRGEFLGTVPITASDWRNATNWRQAALAAAKRVFGDRVGYYVSEQGPIYGG